MTKKELDIFIKLLKKKYKDIYFYNIYDDYATEFIVIVYEINMGKYCYRECFLKKYFDRDNQKLDIEKIEKN